MYKLVPVEADHDMTATVVKPGDDRTEACRIWEAMLDAAPNPWRPIAEAPKDGTYILARKANPKKGRRPAAVIRCLHGRWSDAWAQYHPDMFDGFIPLEWLGSPEDGQ